MATFHKCDCCGFTVNVEDHEKLNQIRLETWRGSLTEPECAFRAEFCDTCYCNMMYELNRMRGR